MVAVPDKDLIAVAHQFLHGFGDVQGDPNASVRRTLKGNVQGTVDRNPVVEVDRVPHAAERTLTEAFDFAVDGEHATRGVRNAALASHQRFFAITVAVLARADRDLFAPLLVAATRHMRDHDRLVAVIDRQHLLRQIHLGVVRRCIWSAGLDDERLLHLIPHVGRDLASRRVARCSEDQLFVRPDCRDGLVAIDAVGWARDEAEFGEPQLHELDVVAGKPLRQGARQWDLDDRRCHCHRTDDIWDGFGNRQHARCGIDDKRSVGGNPIGGVTAAESNTGQHHRPEQAGCRNGGQPFGSLIRHEISSKGTRSA